MQSAYIGRKGHGKSYGVVQNVIAPALKEGRTVFTNIPMNGEECEKRFNKKVVQFEIDDIKNNPKWWTEVLEAGSIVVIDECWRLWPAGMTVKNAREEDKEFLAMNRHMVGANGKSTELVLVTQNLGKIANFARSDIETTYRVKKLEKVGMSNKYRVDVYDGPVTGDNPPESKREREIYGKFSKETYSLYKSHTKSETGEAGDESRVDNRFKVLGGTSLKVGFLAIILCLVAVYFGLINVGEYYGLIDKQTQEPEPQPVVVSSSKTKVKSIPPKPIFTFLSKAESVFVSVYLKEFNDGVLKEQFFFEVNFDESMVMLSDNDLLRLGYNIEVINDCMIKINGSDFNSFALCPKREERKGWVETLVTEQPNQT